MKIEHSEWEIIYEAAEHEDGTLLFPKKLSRDFLDKAKRTMGSYIYANNYLNKIIPEDLQCFKKEWFKYEDNIPLGCFTFITIDPAISQEKGADFTGISVVSVDTDSKWHVRVARRARMTPSEIVNACFDLNKQFQPMQIGVESIAYQKALIYMIHEQMKARNTVIPLVEIKHPRDKSKEMRIRALIPRFEWGLIYLARGLHDLEMELMQFPRGSHDDVCFVADTLIETPSGSHPIQNLSVGDKIITPFGIDKIVAIGNRLKETVKLQYFECTPNHPVFSFDNGFIKASSVSESTHIMEFSIWLLIKLSLLKLFSLMKSNSTLWVRDDIISVKAQQLKGARILKDFMLLFGSFIIKRKFKKASTFIMLTAIHLTTVLKTWSLYRLKNTLSILRKLTEKECSIILKRLDRLQSNGINQKTVIASISSLVSYLGIKRQNQKLNALFVEKQSLLHSQQGLDSAVLGALKEISLQNQFRMKKNVLDVTPSTILEQNHSQNAGAVGLKQVYNIKTTSGMYFAGGILVSNCDALAMMENIVIYPEKRRQENVRPNPANAAEYERWYINQKGSGKTVEREDDFD